MRKTIIASAALAALLGACGTTEKRVGETRAEEDKGKVEDKKKEDDHVFTLWSGATWVDKGEAKRITLGDYLPNVEGFESRVLFGDQRALTVEEARASGVLSVLLPADADLSKVDNRDYFSVDATKGAYIATGFESLESLTPGSPEVVEATVAETHLPLRTEGSIDERIRLAQHTFDVYRRAQTPGEFPERDEAVKAAREGQERFAGVVNHKRLTLHNALRQFKTLAEVRAAVDSFADGSYDRALAERTYASLEDTAKSWEKVLAGHEGFVLYFDSLGTSEDDVFLLGGYKTGEGMKMFADGKYHAQCFSDNDIASGWSVISDQLWK